MDKSNPLEGLTLPSDIDVSGDNINVGSSTAKTVPSSDSKQKSSWKSFFRISAFKKFKANVGSSENELNLKSTPDFVDQSSFKSKESSLLASKLSTIPENTETKNASVETEHSHLLKRADDRQLNNCQAILHLFKVFTGPSTVGMPGIIRNGGILFGTLGFITIGFLNTYASITIVRCGRMLCHRTGMSALRYEELMEMSVRSFSDSVRGQRMARVMRNLTIAMLWLTQFGILALYIQIIGAVFHSEIKRIWPSYTLPLMMTEFFVALCLIPYSLMTNLRILSWFSLLANVFIAVCVVTMVQFACRNLRSTSSLPLISSDPWDIMLFMGASVFTVEGVPMVLPIENRVKHPEDFGGCCGVVTVAATINISINLCLGFFGYLSMGDDVPANFLLALPGLWWYRVISVLYAGMVFLTFTLQLFVPAEFMVTALYERYPGERVKRCGSVVVRISIVVMAYLFAALVPNIELVMSLTGSSSSVTLLFLLPPIAEMLLLSREPQGLQPSVVVRSTLCLLFGSIVLFAGTYASIMEIIETLSS